MGDRTFWAAVLAVGALIIVGLVLVRDGAIRF